MWYKQIIFFLLFLILGMNQSPGVCYVFSFLILLFTLFLIFCGITKIKYEIRDIIPFLFIIVWIYGVVVGFWKNNQINYIVANFAGMFCYSLYYVLILIDLPKRNVVKLLQLASISTSIICLFYFSCDFIGVDSDIFETVIGGVNRGSSTGQTRIYFTGLTVAYSLWTVSFFYIFLPKRECMLHHIEVSKKFLYSVFFVLTFALYFATASKGFMLGGICFVFVLLYLLYGNKLRDGKVSITFFKMLVVLCLLVIIIIVSGYLNIITTLFDSEDASNEVRYLQLIYILNDMDLWGNGLGAIIPNYSRDENAEYGFELSYFNIAHKFGILSIILFISWCYIFYIASRNIYRRENIHNSLYALGSMGYLFPSIGNPLVMHPTCVVLNCLSLYLLRKRQ